MLIPYLICCVLGLLLAIFPASARSAAMALSNEPAELSCLDDSLPDDLRLLCDGLGVAEDLTFDGSNDWTVQSPRAARPSLARKQIAPEFTSRGLARPDTTWPTLPLPPQDRGVGLRLKPAASSLNFSTEMVQAGDGSQPARLNWRMETSLGALTRESGLFWGGAAAGSYNHIGNSEGVSGYAGLRRVIHPAENWRMGAEITPRIVVNDLATFAGSVAVEPKLSSHTDLKLPLKDYRASLDVDLGYRVPLDGAQSSGYGTLRFVIRAR